jgi:hypothetical protein
MTDEHDGNQSGFREHFLGEEDAGADPPLIAVPVGDTRFFAISRSEIPSNYPLINQKWVRRDGRNVREAVPVFDVLHDGRIALPFGEIDLLNEVRRASGMPRVVLATCFMRELRTQTQAEQSQEDQMAIRAVNNAILGVILEFDERHTSVESLVLKILCAFPDAQTTILTPTRWHRRRVRDALAPVLGRLVSQPMNEARSIAGTIQFGLLSDLDSHTVFHSDLVIVTDPLRGLGRDSRPVIDNCPRSRLIGLLGRRTQLSKYDRRRLESVFSHRRLLWGQNPYREMRVFPQRYERRIAQFNNANRLQWKRRAIYGNRNRNLFIAEKALELQEYLRRRNSSGRVAVVVECIEHLRKLMKVFPQAMVHFKNDLTNHGIDEAVRQGLCGARCHPGYALPQAIIVTISGLDALLEEVDGVVVAHGLPIPIDTGYSKITTPLIVCEIVDCNPGILRRAASERVRSYPWQAFLTARELG